MRGSGLIRALTRPRSFEIKAIALALALAAMTAARWSVDRGQSGAPFALYYPLVIVIAVAFGGRWALAAMFLSGALSVYLFFPPVFTFRAKADDLVILTLYAIGCLLIAFFGDVLRATLREADDNAAALSTINRELHHRSRNVATMVRALLHRAKKSGSTDGQFDQLEAQLTALFKANEMLRFGLAETCDLEELVNAVLQPFPLQQFRITGAPCVVNERVVTRLAMILHELATNAVKHGALSNEMGTVRIAWKKAPAQKSKSICITWSEEDGPAVEKPTRKGLGSYLLRPGGGLSSVEADYRPDGFFCSLAFDAD